MTTGMKTQLSNSILIGDIFGMILFGVCIDKFGRRIGIILTTLFLVLVSRSARRLTPANVVGNRHCHSCPRCDHPGNVLDDDYW